MDSCPWVAEPAQDPVFFNERIRNGRQPKTLSGPVLEQTANYLLGFCVSTNTLFLKEYQSSSLNVEVLFNAMLNAARNPVESCFMPTSFFLHNVCKIECWHLDANLAQIQVS